VMVAGMGRLIALGQLDPVRSLHVIHGPDMLAVGRSHFHMFLNLARIDHCVAPLCVETIRSGLALRFF
jgi:hypothetical protein